MSKPKLTLEFLSGPLDGLTVTLEAETDWSRSGDGPLSFPWDEELGTPQARFVIDNGQWQLEALPSERSTRHNMDRVEGAVSLEKGNLLKSAHSWLLITEISPKKET